MQGSDHLDSIGQEVRVGDIIQYSASYSGSISLKFAVVEEFRGPKPKLYKVEVKYDGYWDTPDNQFHKYGDKYIRTGEHIEQIKSSMLDGTDKVIVITNLVLDPSSEVLNELRRRSNELLNGGKGVLLP